jgi:hypothetical protein
MTELYAYILKIKVSEKFESIYEKIIQKFSKLINRAFAKD